MRMIHALGCALLLTCAAARAEACALAGVNITPEGFGLVKVGMTVKEAAKATGGAVVKAEAPNNKCYEAKFVSHDGHAPVRFRVEKNKITVISTTSPELVTPENIGIGSSISDIKRAYPDHFFTRLNAYTDEPDIAVSLAPGSGYVFTTISGKVSGFRAGAAKSIDLEGCE